MFFECSFFVLNLVHLGGTVGELLLGELTLLKVASDAVLSHVDLLSLGLVGKDIFEVSYVSLAFESRLRISLLDVPSLAFLPLEEAHANGYCQDNSDKHGSSYTEKDYVDVDLVFLGFSDRGRVRSCSSNGGSSA